MLFIVSTPIGNLDDITLRAINTLKECDIVACEDTRRTGLLLNHLSIKKRMIAYNNNNERRIARIIVDEIKSGKKVALVSDCGTPGISDPGFYLIRECLNENINVIPIPGASAILSALVCSGLPTDKFHFYGFIGKSEKKKKDFFTGLFDGTTVFYESPYRIIDTLRVMSEIIPDKKIVVARELTKKFEEFIRGTSLEIYSKLKNQTELKGEIVVIVSNRE